MSDWADAIASGLRLPAERQGDMAAALRRTRDGAVRGFATAILHGDVVHRAWLAEAADAFIAGKPTPPPRDAKTHQE